MYKPDDKDIDRLSRDAAEHYHAPGKPAWDALQQILDKELPQEKEKKRRGFFFFLWLLLGLSVAGSGLWYSLGVNHENKTIALSAKPGSKDNSGKPVATQQQTEATGNNSPENNATPATGSANTSNKLKETDAAPVTSAVIKNTAAGIKSAADPAAKPANSSNIKKISNTGTAAAPVASNNSIAPNLNKTNNTKATTASPLYNNEKTVAGKKIKNNSALNTTDLTNSTGNNDPAGNGAAKQHGIKSLATAGISGYNTNKYKKQAGKKYAGNPASIEGGTAISATDTAVKDPVATKTNDDNSVNSDNTTAKIDKQLTTAPDTIAATKPAAKPPVAVTAGKDSAVVAKKKAISKKDRAINFGILAGIDESTVKFTNSSNVGYNIGITGGYQFSKHWSVSTGVIYTKKNYDLNGKDFHPPHPYWTLYVNLQDVQGYCKMWEIPLQARYTFNPGAKTPFFASAGLSSYFMTKQYYDYSYKNNMNQPMTGAWGTDSTFKHVFSILAFSAGFEKQLGKHMNWQIEPYAKIPLGGVGFGNIKLSSFGINLSIQYRHPVKR